MRPILRTERLELRPMRTEHLPLLHTLDSDPEVMRYLTGCARSAEEIDAFWGPRCADTTLDRRGLGWWVGFADAQFVGWWDLGRSARPPESVPARDRAEIGWRVRRTEWGRGYATEGARALLRHGFATAGLSTVRAETMAVNTRSRRVMTKIGMQHVATDHRVWDDPLPGAHLGEVVYEISAEQWKATQDVG